MGREYTREEALEEIYADALRAPADRDSTLRQVTDAVEECSMVFGKSRSGYRTRQLNESGKI